MSDKKRKVPKLRFPGFTDAWEQRKLGDMGKVSMCKRVFKSETSEIGEVPFYKIGTFGEVADSYISKDLFEEYRDKYSYPKVGDILISASGSIGRTVVYTGQAEYFQDSNIVWLDHGGKIDNRFLLAFYSVVKWSGIEGSTIKRLYNENILNTQISLPSLSEQATVGNFFREFDSLISLHQRKLDNVKMLKKSLLQKLFPKDGEKIPELRFPGFTDDWEQRKLGEVVGVNSGRDYKHLESGDFPVYGTGGYMLSVSEALSYTEDAIGIGRKGTIDKPFILKAPFWTVDTLFYCIPKGENDLEFVFSLFQNITWKKLDESTGVPSLSKQLIDNVRVTIPSEKEQAQLGYIFESINTLISLHQRKLDHLKELKKGLLQQMFV